VVISCAGCSALLATGEVQTYKPAEEKGTSSAQAELVEIGYRNYRGEVSIRCIVPQEIYFGSNEWHPEKQWLLRALDLEKDAQRSFAMKDVLSWSPLKDHE